MSVARHCGLISQSHHFSIYLKIVKYKVIIFLALKEMAKIQCHEAGTVPGLVTVTEKGPATSGFFLLSWAPLTMTPDLHFPEFREKSTLLLP